MSRKSKYLRKKCKGIQDPHHPRPTQEAAWWVLKMTDRVLELLVFLKKTKPYPTPLPSSPLIVGHYTWSTENIKDETGQHEGQDRPIITQCALTKFFCPAPNGTHFTGTPRDLLKQTSYLRFLICQLYLKVQEGTQTSSTSMEIMV